MMKAAVVLKGGQVVDPAQGISGVADVRIEGSRMAAVGPDLPLDGAAVIEVPAGFVVCPGFIDMHVHFREPGAGAQGDDCERGRRRGGRRIRGGGLHAEHGSGQRPCRRDRGNRSQGGRGRARQGLPDRCGVGQVGRGADDRDPVAPGGRLCRNLRRRPSGRQCAPDAAGSRVRVDVRDTGHQPLRGGRRSRPAASCTRAIGQRPSVCAASPARPSRSWWSGTSA